MVVGQYVRTFAEASHASIEGMHMNADYPFKIPSVSQVNGGMVTLKGYGGKTITAKIKRHRDGREYCEIEQSSSFEAIYKRRPTKFRCFPFKDENTPAIGVSDDESPLFV